MTEYDAATAVFRRDDYSFTADLDPQWFVVAPNGGYLAALLMRAAQLVPESDGRLARSMTTHFPQVGVAGPVTLHVEVTRAGRSIVYTTVRMHQGDRLLAQSMVALGHGRSELSFQDLRPPPGLPDVDATPAPLIPEAVMPPIAHRFDYRPTDPVPMFSAQTSDMWVWVRLREPRPLDDGLLALMTDALPPALFFREVPPHVYPTIDLTVHLRNRPAPAYDDWCLAHVATRTAAEGFIEEDCDIYDRSGSLLAQGRQLALMVPLS